MSLVLSNIGKAFKESSFIDDVFDRLHRKFMVLVLAVTCIIIGGNQFVGNPINCYLGAEFGGPQVDYINQYCWTASTYQILTDFSDDSNGPFESFRGEKKNGDSVDHGTVGEKRFVSYYQWIPIVLVLQAISFYIPYIIWRNMSKMSGIHLPNFMKGVYELAKIQSNNSARGFLLEDVIILFRQFLALKKRTERRKRYLPNFLVSAYFSSKCLYLANVLFQLIALHSFLQTEIISHSFKVIKKMLFDRDWTASVRFPIRTICEYKGTPQMNNYLLSHTTHCVLPINLYNDKIFAVIAFLLLSLSILSVLGIVIWMIRIFFPREKIVLDQLKSLGVKTSNNELTSDFIHKYLGRDGRFVLQLIDRNIGRVTCVAVVEQLWEKFKEEEEATSLDSVSYTSQDEEKKSLYPDIKKNKKKPTAPSGGEGGPLKTLRCEECLTEIAGEKEGCLCPTCGKVVDY